MQRIINEPIVNPASDLPVEAAFEKRDAKGKPIPLRDKEGNPRRDPFGNVMNEQVEGVMTTALAIRILVTNAFPARAEAGHPLQPATHDDSVRAMKVLDRLRPFKLLDVAFVEKQPKTIKLDQDDYTWLLNLARARACSIWGIFGSLYVAALEKLDKVEEPPKAGGGNGVEAGRLAEATT